MNWLTNKIMSHFLISSREKKKKLKNLFKENKELLRDPSRGAEDLDITLLCKVIRHGNFQLADGDDDEKWRAGKNHIESLVTRVKDLRNEVSHEDLLLSKEEFEERTEMLRKLLTDILQCAERTYKSNASQMIHEIHKNINEFRDNIVEDVEIFRYRFHKLCKRVRTEGKENVKRQYCDLEETVVNTVNPIIELSCPVEDIFSDMELKKSDGNEEKISYGQILEGLRYDISDPIILLEGEAGVGKTTIVKKIIRDWMNGTTSFKELQSFDMVLHHECRNAFIKDYDRFLEEKMPDIAQDLNKGELRRATLNVRSMIILDGLDELNDASTVLFEEILDIKKKYGLTVVVTSRPEKLQYLANNLKSRNLDLKNISILGIPLNQRKTFVEKYHEKLTEMEKRKGTVNVPVIEELVSYMEKTQLRLSNVWRFPYNLTFLTILYVVKRIDLWKITTAPELYREIFRLYYTRLMERLRHSQETRCLQKSESEWKTKIFLHALAKESIIGLMKDQINLQHEAYMSLKEVCKNISIPAEQMIGAFLKKVPSISSLSVYGYPHKGIQDYLSAQFVWMLLSGEYESADIHKAIGDVLATLSKYSLSPHISLGIMKVFEQEKRKKQNSFTGKTFDGVGTIKDEILQDKDSLSLETANKKPRISSEDLKNTSRKIEEENLSSASMVVANQPLNQKSTIIRDILHEIYTECYQVAAQRQISQQLSINTHGSASNSDTKSGTGYEIHKFQNMLLCLLGMFYTEGEKVQDDIKLEVLKLLQETGVKDSKAWLNVLSNVKCDAFVASFIARQKYILEGEIEIDDASLFPYLSLMKSLENPPENVKDVKIHLDIEQFSERKDLLFEIKRLRFEVHVVTITDDNADAYLTVLKELKGMLSSDHKIDIRIKEVSSNVIALLSDVNSLNLNVNILRLETHFRNPSVYDHLQWQTQINQIMKRCPVEIYMGSMTEISFSYSLREISVSVTTKEEIKTLNSFIKQSHRLQLLLVCVSADVDHRNFIPIHHPRGILSFSPYLYIVDVTEENKMNSVNIIKSLQPLNGDEKFRGILFPRCNRNINPLDLMESMGRMKGIRSHSLHFPSSLRPQQQQQQQLVKEEAKRILGCIDVRWGTDDWGNSIDDW